MHYALYMDLEGDDLRQNRDLLTLLKSAVFVNGRFILTPKQEAGDRSDCLIAQGELFQNLVVALKGADVFFRLTAVGGPAHELSMAHMPCLTFMEQAIADAAKSENG